MSDRNKVAYHLFLLYSCWTKGALHKLEDSPLSFEGNLQNSSMYLEYTEMIWIPNTLYHYKDFLGRLCFQDIAFMGQLDFT